MEEFERDFKINQKIFEHDPNDDNEVKVIALLPTENLLDGRKKVETLTVEPERAKATDEAPEEVASARSPTRVVIKEEPSIATASTLGKPPLFKASASQLPRKSSLKGKDSTRSQLRKSASISTIKPMTSSLQTLSTSEDGKSY